MKSDYTAYRTASKAGVVPAQYRVAIYSTHQHDIWHMKYRKTPCFSTKGVKKNYYKVSWLLWCRGFLTLQWSVHAAHLIESCVPLTADDLWQNSYISRPKWKVTDVTSSVGLWKKPKASKTTNHCRHLPGSGFSVPRLSFDPQTLCRSHYHRRPQACSSGHQTVIKMEQKMTENDGQCWELSIDREWLWVFCFLFFYFYLFY